MTPAAAAPGAGPLEPELAPDECPLDPVDALRRSEARYRALVEASAGVVWSWAPGRPAGEVTRAHRWWEAVTGQPPADQTRTPTGWADAVHPDDRAGAAAGWEAALAAGAPYDMEYRVRARAGGWRHLHARGVPVPGGPGAREWVGTLTDVTDRVRAAADRRAAEERLRQAAKMEAVGQLAGGVAHDFNNLLTVINGYSGQALKAARPGDPHAEALAEIHAAGRRAAALTRQLLAFGRRQVLQPREVGLNGLVADLVRMLGRLLGEDVRLVTDLSPAAGAVRVDPGQLEQVVVNLCVNARDAMPRGGTLTVATDAVARPAPDAGADGPPGRYARLAVTDTGCGMTDAVRERVFEPFFTTKGVGEGSGLGLSTVLGIVEQSGGRVEVRTAPGAGSTFAVLLPRTSAAPAAEAEAPAPRPAAPRGRETVLLVEDEPAVRRLAAAVLRRAGYAVLEAGGAAEAAGAHARAAGAVALLLTDVVMPHQSGRELADRLTRADPGLRVLFMSGYPGDRVGRYGVPPAGAIRMLRTAPRLTRSQPDA